MPHYSYTIHGVFVLSMGPTVPTVPPSDHLLHHQLIPRNAGHPPRQFQDGHVQPARTGRRFSCGVADRNMLGTGAVLPATCPYSIKIHYIYIYHVCTICVYIYISCMCIYIYIYIYHVCLNKYIYI